MIIFPKIPVHQPSATDGAGDWTTGNAIDKTRKAQQKLPVIIDNYRDAQLRNCI
jgi:hypothetical protein